MTLYVLAALAIAGVVAAALAVNFGFFSAGKTDGNATATAKQAQTDLAATKKADAIAMTNKTSDDVVKSLNNGTF